MTHEDDADDPVFAALSGLPRLDVGRSRARRLAARCRASLAQPARVADSRNRAGSASWAPATGLALVAAWSAVYVAAVVRSGWLVWGL